MENQETITQEQYAELVLLYKLGLNMVNMAILNLAIAWEHSNKRSIYETIKQRLKEYASTLEKCQRKGIPATLESIKKGIQDIAGIRIITSVISDIYKIREAIANQPGLELIEEQDYVHVSKESGYRSLHLKVSVQVYFRGVTKSVPVEIQIRTKLMDHWSTIHHIAYKGNPSEEVKTRFFEWSEELYQQDLKAEELLGLTA